MITQINIVKEPEYYYPAVILEAGKSGLMTYEESSKLSDLPNASNIVQKSQTEGLLRNNGTVDTNSYVKKSDIETEKTATGNPITLTDAIAGNAIEVSAEIVASQDLHGYDKPWVGGAGKNKCPNLKYQSSSTTIYIGQNNGTDFPFDLVANTTYTFSFNFANGFSVYLRHESESSGTNIGEASSYISFTPTLSGKYRIACYNGGGVSVDNVSNIQLEVGSAPTSYEPYTNICPITGFSSVVITDVDAESHTATVTVALGSTVYGGTLDLTTGELTITHANIASYNGETIGEPWISSMDEYTQGGTPTTGAQVVYTLATPTTTTLTAAQLALVKGYNQLTCNSGDMSITYKASSLDAWKDRVDELDNRVDELEDAVEDIEDRIDDVETALAGKANVEPYFEQSVTLSTSQTTTVTFTDARILATSFIEPAISVWGIFPEDVTVANGSCTVVMPKVSSAQTVTVGIFIKR